MKETVSKNLRALTVGNSKKLKMLIAVCVVALVMCLCNVGAFANGPSVSDVSEKNAAQGDVVNPADAPSTDTESGTTGDGDATKGDITNPATDADKDGKIAEKDGKLENTAGATQTSTETANINTNANDCKCLCFTAEDTSCSVTLNKTEDMTTSRDIKYSMDAGTTWNTWSFDSKLDFKKGEKIYVKGDNAEGLSIYYDKYIYFSISGKVASSGNIMSLLDDGKCDTYTIPNNYCFYSLFRGCKTLTSAPELPATTLAAYCYSSMFGTCESLTSAPNLPAKNLGRRCYTFMFDSCILLTSAPNLPATNLEDGCYRAMFINCLSLKSASELPATTLADTCYCSMFEKCKSLTSAPNLPATTLADNCYLDMFRSCTSLTTAPELPATTLADNCYSGMFYGCTSLTTAPKLNADKLGINCYQYMFYGCTSLTTAPELPATTLAYSCYYNMFKCCTSIDKAPKLPATNLVEACYACMFEECTSLKTAPELPAKSLPQLCYLGMFYKCTSLEKPADISHVNVINKNCCTHMYWGCSGMQVYNNHREGYQKEWTTPNADEISEWSTDMFTGTSGDVSGNVTTKTTYFIKNGIDYVAEVKETGKKYETVQAAIDAVGDSGQTVKMLKDSTEDVTIGNDGKVTIDLNGHVLKGTGSNSVITSNGSSLTINDSVSADSSTHYFTLHKQSKWDYIENPTSEQISGSIDIDSVVSTTPDGAIVSVNGGVVTGGNKTTDDEQDGGGAICLYSGNSVINNGNFIGNIANKCFGGGVFVNHECSLTLNNGKICGNQAVSASETNGYGGGVFVNNSRLGTVNGKFETMGGSISNNCAFAGGGIDTVGDTSLLGGQICNNTTKSGDIFGSGVTMRSSGASMTLGGDLVIKDNKDIESANGNIERNFALFDEWNTFTVSSSKRLTTGASIGITTQTDPTLTNPVILSGKNDADYSQYFSSDNARFKVKNGENNVLQLEVKTGIDINDATVSGVEESYTYTGSKIKPPVTVTYEGTTLTKGVDYNVSYGNNTTVDEGGTVTIDGIGIFTGTKTIKFDITKASVEVPKAETNLAYNGQDQTGVKNQDPAKYNLTGNVAKVAGDYVATASLKDKGNYEWITNNTSEDQSISWSIAKAKVDVPQAKTNLIYNGEKQIGVEIPRGAKYDVSGEVSGVDASNYIVEVALKDKNNYEWNLTPTTVEDQSISWSINKRPITFTSDSATKEYDGTALTAENVTVSGMGFAEGEDASYEFDASQKEIGSCANTFKVLWTEADESNYEPNLVYGTLEVTSPVQPTPSDDNTGSTANKYSNANSSSSTGDNNALVVFGLLFVVVASSCTINIYRKKLNKNIK